MLKQWWCADCRTPAELDRHGRCGTCGSDAVASMERPRRTQGNWTVPSMTPMAELPQYSGAI